MTSALNLALSQSRFSSLGEIENHIRGILGPLSKAELAAAADPGDGEREVEDVADLTFGEYLDFLLTRRFGRNWA